MNPKPANNTLPRPTAALPEPFDDLFGNIESKVLLLTIISGCTASGNERGIEGHRGVDLINAIDLLHVEIKEGLRQLKGNFTML